MREANLHLDQLGSNHQTDSRSPLSPHRQTGHVRPGRRPSLGSAPFQQRTECIEVRHMIARPVFESSVKYIELKRHEPIEEVLPGRRGFHSVQDDEEIGTFGRSLVEKAEARKACEAQIPELEPCDWEDSAFCSTVAVIHSHSISQALRQVCSRQFGLGPS
jgi:uncharacterized protein (DUF779 family)